MCINQEKYNHENILSFRVSGEGRCAWDG